MKTTHTKTIYVEWLNATVMHDASRKWLSELLFIKDEQLFFNDLIKSYTLQLIDSSHFSESKNVIDKLIKTQKKTNKLLQAVENHERDLKVMVDVIEQVEEEEAYKEEHRVLIVLVNDFFQNYQAMKRQLFTLIKSIIKEQKQKRLLE